MKIPPNSTCYTEALHELLAVRLALANYPRALAAGKELAELGADSRIGVFNTSLALTFLGRLQEARGLLSQLPQLGEHSANEAYQMACLDTALGNHEMALHWLVLALAQSESYGAKALIDSDLQPLWRSLEASMPCLQAAHFLLEPTFDDPRLWATDCSEDPEFDANDLRQFPATWRPLFRFSARTGTHSIHALTAAREPEARAECLQWVRRRVELSLQSIEVARERARQLVLQNQVAYATLHLRVGNHLAGRCHLLWALEQDPVLLTEFRANRMLRPLSGVLDELSYLNKAAPMWTERLIKACLHHLVTDDDVLDDAPAAAHGTSLFLLGKGLALHNSRDYAAALPVWLSLCLRWPQDSVGFGNGVTCLMHMGHWDRAHTLLSRAPKSYRCFHLHAAQQTRLAARDVEVAPDPPCQPFRGQPDLGGVLCRSFTL